MSDSVVISKVFHDTDFKDRTLMKIITTNGYDMLFRGEKINVLMEEIWMGRDSSECDSTITDYSVLSYLASTPITVIPGRQLTLGQLLNNNFKP